MLLLMKGNIFIEGKFYFLPSVSALRKLLLCAIIHMVYVAWTKVVIIYELLAHYSITIFLAGFRYVQESDPQNIATVLSQISALSVMNK